jgi:hypothetical protein
VPPALVEAVGRLMQKTPEGRYAGVSDVVEVLRTLADPVVRTAPALAPAPAPAARASRPATMAGDFSIGRPREAAPAPTRPSQRPTTMPAVFTPRHAVPTQTNIDLQAAAPARGAARVLRPVSVPKLPVPAPAPTPEQAAAEAPQERVVPGASFAQPAGGRTWEDRIGPVGIAIGAFVLCVAAWFAASQFLLK